MSKSPINLKIDLAPLETVAVFILGLVGAGAVFLALGLRKGDHAAYLVLGGVITVALMALGGAVVIAVILFAKWAERGREARDAEQHREYSRDQWRTMSEIQRTQNQQNALLLKQGRELARSLPAPGDDLDVDALIFDNAVFDELED